MAVLSFWRHLAEVGYKCGLSPQWCEHKNAVLHGVHVIWAYLGSKIFEVLGTLPWRLARGDMIENLRLLLLDPAVEEPIARKICALHLGPSARTHCFFFCEQITPPPCK